MFFNFFLVLATSFAWAMSFIFQKILVDVFDPISITFFRTSIASFCFYFTLIALKQTHDLFRYFQAEFILLGLVNLVVPLAFCTWSAKFISAGVIGSLMSCSGMVTLFLAHIMTDDEKLNWLKVFCFSIATLGVVLLYSQTPMTNLEDRRSVLLGYGLTIVATIGYAYSTIRLKKFRHTPIFITLFYLFFWSSVFLLPFVVILGNYPSYHEPVWLQMLALGLVSTALPFLFRQILIQRTSASFVSIIGYVIPLFTVGLGWLILNETFSLLMGVGLGLILISVYFASRSF